MDISEALEILHQHRDWYERENPKNALDLMEMITPMGKPLKECTGEECEEIGRWYRALATVEYNRASRLELLANSKTPPETA